MKRNPPAPVSLMMQRRLIKERLGLAAAREYDELLHRIKTASGPADIYIVETRPATAKTSEDE